MTLASTSTVSLAVAAAIAVFSSITAPLLLVYLTGKQRIAADAAIAAQRHKEKLEDWARQDAVAADLLASNERVAETAKVTNGKLDTIHVLVNSNLTAAMEAELDATIRDLASMTEVLELKRMGGQEPTPEAVAAIAGATTRVADLKAQLADRLRQSAAIAAAADDG